MLLLLSQTLTDYDDSSLFSNNFKQIGIFGELDYSDKAVQTDLELMLRQIENYKRFAGASFTESWLRDYLQYVSMNSDSDDPLDVLTEDTFISALQSVSVLHIFRFCLLFPIVCKYILVTGRILVIESIFNSFKRKNAHAF
jgi:hypothetical protein